MPRRIKTPIVEQIELFHPPPCLPPWSSLPEDAKQETIGLLIQILMAHAQPVGVVKTEKEQQNND